MFHKLSKNALLQIAIEILEGRVFAHIQCNNRGQVYSIFPLHFLGVSSIDLDKIGLVYEYTYKAISMNDKGFPVFNTFKLLDKSDAEYVVKEIIKYKAVSLQIF